MRLLSPLQMDILIELTHRRMGVLEVHANSAASLMFKQCINYRTERSGYVTYAITAEGRTMLSTQQAIDGSSKTFDSLRKNVMASKHKGTERAKTVLKSTTKRARRRRSQLKAVA